MSSIKKYVSRDGANCNNIGIIILVAVGNIMGSSTNANVLYFIKWIVLFYYWYVDQTYIRKKKHQFT